MRKASIDRNTTETSIGGVVNLDGVGNYFIKTSIPFLDHMLEQFSRHSMIDLEITVNGDLQIDAHHTAEDSALAIGQAINKALGNRIGICRYGSALLPMDETLSRVVIDLSNRPYLIWKVCFSRDKLGTMDSELFKEWFYSFAQALGATIHVETLYGENNHHIAESCFKALAIALHDAITIYDRNVNIIPSTKGTLTEI
ncbi:MAG: imidazoleglycerol-phosphate dehydratase HisB [Rhodospirillaceae bacterium]|jgi:imidazoleglycerol-phosphate dehydratase|nr:imidazoleglycerol-phosphate dehydratase HisB [Rhodospirillaceae bacterium]